VFNREGRVLLQVLFLSDGIKWHSDNRRNSVAAAVQWAAQNSLQGLVLECGALRSQPEAVAAARQQGLQVRMAAAKTRALMCCSIR
jgi:hypothetical protein